MRSDWTPHANWLLFDAGPYGGPHGHEDKLSIELAVLGELVIVDPGFYTYQKDDPFRNYFISSQAHSTITIDGYGQMRRWQGEHIKPRIEKPCGAAWRTTELFDYAAGVYDEGYGRIAALRTDSSPPLVHGSHRRHVFFIKPDYWCIIDDVQVDGPGEHLYERLFQLAPAAKVELCFDRVSVTRNHVGLEILPVGESGVQYEIYTGEMDPARGWYSADHFRKQPSSTLSIRRSAGDRFWAVTLLVPVQDGGPVPRIELPTEGVSTPRFGFELHVGGWHDRIDVLLRDASEAILARGPGRCGPRMVTFERHTASGLSARFEQSLL
jgi:hypothetical protein